MRAIAQRESDNAVLLKRVNWYSTYKVIGADKQYRVDAGDPNLWRATQIRWRQRRFIYRLSLERRLIFYFSKQHIQEYISMCYKHSCMIHLRIL